MTVEDQVLEALGLRVVFTGLSVDESEQPLACGAEEVVTAVVGGFVQRRDVGRALEHGRERLARVGAQVDDRLAGVEALDEQQVGIGLQELAGRRRRRDVHPEHPVLGVGVMDDVERPFTGCDDRRVVDDVRARDLDERAVAGSGDGARLEVLQREAGRPRFRNPRRAEVRSALEVHDGGAEVVLLGRG